MTKKKFVEVVTEGLKFHLENVKKSNPKFSDYHENFGAAAACQVVLDLLKEVDAKEFEDVTFN